MPDAPHLSYLYLCPKIWCMTCFIVKLLNFFGLISHSAPGVIFEEYFQLLLSKFLFRLSMPTQYYAYLLQSTVSKGHRYNIQNMLEKSQIMVNNFSNFKRPFLMKMVCCLYVLQILQHVCLS